MDQTDDLEKPLMAQDNEGGRSPTSTIAPCAACEYSQATPRLRSKWTSFIWPVVLTVTVLIWTSLLVWYTQHRTVSPFALIDRGHCGWSIEEAKANDCVFDIMLSSWIPKPCYDKELSDQFLRTNNFTYWRKNDGEDEVSEEEVRRGEFDILFTHGTYHSQHCM
jgi:hypothetical protein